MRPPICCWIGITQSANRGEDGRVWSIPAIISLPVSPTPRRSISGPFVRITALVIRGREILAASIDYAFSGQDKPMIEAQQAVLGDGTSMI